MTEEIIIDGINVAGCGYFCEYDEECSICGMGTDGEDTFCKYCKDNSNCYYKQLKRLEQENIKQKEMIDRQWKLLAECGVSAGGELKRVSYLLENLRKENAEHKAENERLKEFCIELEKQKEKQHNQWFERCTENHNEDSKIIENYHSALEEIKEIAMGIMDDDIEETSSYYDANLIINKINEVLK